MSLKQKIRENMATIYNVLRGFEHERKYVFPSGLVAYDKDKVMLVDDVLGLLDEATHGFPCLECYNWKEGKCNPYKGFVCSHQEYVEWFLAVLGSSCG